MVFLDKALFIEVKINDVNNKKYECPEDVLKEVNEERAYHKILHREYPNKKIFGLVLVFNLNKK